MTLRFCEFWLQKHMPASVLAVQYQNDAPLAQLDRASGFEPEGWGFKSLGVRHFFLKVTVPPPIHRISQ